ncbi:MAG: secondary thiamine-phosphate synthase enzyme YjbQ [Desulfuromonadales bacterium]|nr:secondary thiamine-phosphate synthase enzyme YjbQ [Desulfuromonadales bacterium]
MITLAVQSHHQVEMVDITRAASQAIRDCGITDGVAVIYTPHTTAAITINENADPDVSHDMVMAINKMVPMLDGYRHLEGNSAAHIKSSLFGASEMLMIENGNLILGTWQGLYFCEFDGPRQRKVHIKVIGT